MGLFDSGAEQEGQMCCVNGALAQQTVGRGGQVGLITVDGEGSGGGGGGGAH